MKTKENYKDVSNIIVEINQIVRQAEAKG